MDVYTDVLCFIRHLPGFSLRQGRAVSVPEQASVSSCLQNEYCVIWEPQPLSLPQVHAPGFLHRASQI